MNKQLTAAGIRAALESKLARYYGTTLKEAGDEQLLQSLQLTVRDILTDGRSRYNRAVRAAGGKRSITSAWSSSWGGR